MNMYQEHVMDHARHPRGRGTATNANVVFTDKNPLCGDTITISLRVEKGIIIDAKHEASGCAISQAAASMLFEELKGTSVKDFLQRDKELALAEFGTTLSVSRVKCALLPFTATKKALTTHYANHN